MKKSKKKIVILIIIILSLAFGGYYVFRHDHGDHGKKESESTQYTCPMHPQIISDKPGDCPICGMKLVPIKKDKSPEKVAKQKRIMYKSSMNPGEISDKPGKDSMGMDMIPFEVNDSGEKYSDLAPVSVPAEKRAMMGLTFERVKTKKIFREVRSSARIVSDETLMYRVTTKVSGWIEKLYVNQTGQYVKKGAPILTVYSPDLLTAQQEYLLALKASDKLSASSDTYMKDSMKEIKESARERLRLLDITDEQIKHIESTGKFERAVTIYSKVSGYVVEKMALPGQKIMMNDTLMTISDLSRIWGEIDIYESDLPYVKTGMSVEITLSYWKDKNFRGRVAFIYPYLDKDTRTAKARIEIPNKGLILKPQMYADARLFYSLGSKLAVPESAVMRNGIKDYVFIEGKEDMIIPKEIKVGLQGSNGYYEVISGLKGGEMVVTSANFLIDSESSLKAAFQSAAESHKHEGDKK